MRLHAVLTVTTTWILLAGLYLLFAGSLGAAEVMAAVACASLGTIWARRIGQVGEAPFRWTAATLRPMAGALACLPGRTPRVGFRLMHAIVGGKGPGSVQHRPASTMSRRPVSDTNAEARAERAVGVLAASLSPDSYVLRFDPACPEIVLHAFAGGRASE